MQSRRLFALLVAFALVAVSAAPAGAQAYTNTATSSSGATLVSAGVCGGLFNFSVRSSGFEYLQIGEVDGPDVTWGEWTAVPQYSAYRYDLPVAYQSKAYVVQGADWVGGQWEIHQVVTWFNRITGGDNYGTWTC